MTRPPGSSSRERPRAADVPFEAAVTQHERAVRHTVLGAYPAATSLSAVQIFRDHLLDAFTEVLSRCRSAPES